MSGTNDANGAEGECPLHCTGFLHNEVRNDEVKNDEVRNGGTENGKNIKKIACSERCAEARGI